MHAQLAVSQTGDDIPVDEIAIEASDIDMTICSTVFAFTLMIARSYWIAVAVHGADILTAEQFHDKSTLRARIRHDLRESWYKSRRINHAIASADDSVRGREHSSQSSSCVI